MPDVQPRTGWLDFRAKEWMEGPCACDKVESLGFSNGILRCTFRIGRRIVLAYKLLTIKRTTYESYLISNLLGLGNARLLVSETATRASYDARTELRRATETLPSRWKNAFQYAGPQIAAARQKPFPVRSRDMCELRLRA